MTNLIVKPRSEREKYAEFRQLKRSYVQLPVVKLENWRKFKATEEELVRRVKIEDQESSKKGK